MEDLLPEICTLDCGSFNYPDEHYVYISTSAMLREASARLQEIGVKPELEIFDLGQMAFAKQLLAEGLLDAPPLLQICLGIKWGAEANTTVLKAMVDSLPTNSNWGGFSVGAMQMPMVAQSILLGGNVRVGLEDNLYLEKGVHASNAQLVERACTIADMMGCRIQSAAEARETLGLRAPG